MAAKKYFWIKKNGNFGPSIKFGDPVPALDSDMEKYLLGKGWISLKKPDSFVGADASAFEDMKNSYSILGAENEQFRKKNLFLEKDNKELSEENVDLKNQVTELDKLKEANQTLSDEVTELKAELEDFPENVKKANKQIKKLEKDLEKATDPGGK